MEELEKEKVEATVEPLPFKEPVESSLMAQSHVVNNITNNNITNNIIITNSNNVVSVDPAKETQLAVRKAKRGAAIAAFTAAATIGIATLFAPKETSAPEPDPVRVETEVDNSELTVQAETQVVEKPINQQTVYDQVYSDLADDGRLNDDETVDVLTKAADELGKDYASQVATMAGRDGAATYYAQQDVNKYAEKKNVQQVYDSLYGNIEGVKEKYIEDYNKENPDRQMVSSHKEAGELKDKKEADLQSTFDQVYNDVKEDGKLDNPVVANSETEQNLVNRAISDGVQYFENTQSIEEGRSR